MKDIKGTRWYKCDFHLHTTHSKCFEDQAVTPKQWVDRAIEQGLDCVAITDHNSGLGVDSIKAAAEGTSLVVFPGLEITCDTGKIHLLIIFDVNQSSADVRDFLVKADIDAKDFGEQTAYTIKSVFEIAKLAEGKALIIPSHIDSYSGLSSLNKSILKDFYSLDNINGVQVVHGEFLDTNLKIKKDVELQAKLNNLYGNPNPPISSEILQTWQTPVIEAINKNLSILTFSDNPHAPMSPKHGLAGIGESYTWIKMDENPSLESLRQALLLPEFRIRNKIQSNENPYVKPDVWIKSISVFDTTITKDGVPLKIDFSPQLNTIIGGRGSGKSSVIRFVRGVFNRKIDQNDNQSLNNIIADQDDFYKVESGRPKKGVLTNKSIIEIEIVRNESLYKVTASDIKNSDIQSIKIELFDEESSTWSLNEDEGFIKFFEFEQYSQKQIYEIAQEPNALREKIDYAINGVDQVKQDRELIKKQFLEKSAEIRTIDLLIKDKGLIETNISDLEHKIKKLQKSGIADLLSSKEQFIKEKKVLTTFTEKIKSKETLLDSFIEGLDFTDIDYEIFNDEYTDLLKPISQKINKHYEGIKTELKKLKTSTVKENNSFTEAIKTSKWNVDFGINIKKLQDMKLKLEEEGVDDIANYEKFTEDKETFEQKLDKIKDKTLEKHELIKERKALQEQYFEKCNQLTSLREEFVGSLSIDNKLKITIKQFRNKADYENNLRGILQKSDTFQDDIDKLIKMCFSGEVINTIKKVRQIFLDIRNDQDINKAVSGSFIKVVKNLNDTQIDEIELLFPEDEIQIQYKPNKRSAFKSLSIASAGQKTTAILTFLLSYGKTPLILDQPEDDLDNKLVYDLIVDRLKSAKEERQLIIVTHNANIPVNGDAEYIISMNSESKKLEVLYSGAVEQEKIKKEICDVMEGSEGAFDMRSRRYKQI